MNFGKKTAAGIDNTGRRKWDKDEFRKKAEEKKKEEEEEEQEEKESALDARRRKRLERDPLHQGLIVQRSHLQARGYELNLASRVGKTQVVSLNTPLNQQAGYYCQVCDCILRDSMSYLDHINGKWHNRALGMTMRVEKSSVDQVKNRFEMLKKQKQEQKSDDYVPDGFDKRALDALEAEERERELKRERKREKKQKEEEEESQDADQEMMALMGFGGFGTSKKHKKAFKLNKFHKL